MDRLGKLPRVGVLDLVSPARTSCRAPHGRFMSAVSSCLLRYPMCSEEAGAPCTPQCSCERADLRASSRIGMERVACTYRPRGAATRKRPRKPARARKGALAAHGCFKRSRDFAPSSLRLARLVRVASQQSALRLGGLPVQPISKSQRSIKSRLLRIGDSNRRGHEGERHPLRTFVAPVAGATLADAAPSIKAGVEFGTRH